MIFRPIALLIVLASASVVTACGLSKDGASPGSITQAVTSASPLQAFDTGFHTWAKRNCVGCHDVGENPPAFAQTDAGSACRALFPSPGDKTYVNFSSPDSGQLVAYVGTGSCMSGAGTAQDKATVKGFLQTWLAAIPTGGDPCSNVVPGGSGGSGSGGNPAVCPAGLTPTAATATSTTVMLPAPSALPPATAGSGKIVRWNPMTFNQAIAGATGFVFEVQVSLNTNNTYRITFPRMLVPNGDAAAGFTGIHVMIANPASPTSLCEFSIGEEWTQVSSTVSPSTIPNPLPSGPLSSTPLSNLSVDLPVLSNTDQIAIGFDNLTP
jgi:hypothetical protein